MRTKARRHPSLEAKVVEVASWEAMRVEARKRIVERRRPKTVMSVLFVKTQTAAGFLS